MPGNENICQSILPVNSTLPHFPQHYDKEEHVLAVNKLLKANAFGW